MSDLSQNQSNYKLPWLDEAPSAPTVPHCILDLPDVLIKACLSFVGRGNYNLVARTCHLLQDQYPFAKETTWESAAASVACAQFCLDDNLEEGEMSKEEVLDELEQKAAWMGQVCVLQWIHQEHGRCCMEGACPHFRLDSSTSRSSSVLCLATAKGGHLSVLHWMKQHSVLHASNDEVWVEAAREGHVHVLQWLYENQFTSDYRASAVGTAVLGGRSDVLEWARDHGVSFLFPRVCSLAASKGHLDTLQWLRDHGCPWNSETIRSALRNGHDSIAQWARDNGCPEPRTPFAAWLDDW